MPGSVIHQPILHTFTEEACEDRLFCCSVIDGKPQPKHTSAAKKSDINKTKKHNER